jgi:hypothetical protein
MTVQTQSFSLPAQLCVLKAHLTGDNIAEVMDPEDNKPGTITCWFVVVDPTSRDSA